MCYVVSTDDADCRVLNLYEIDTVRDEDIDTMKSGTANEWEVVRFTWTPLI